MDKTRPVNEQASSPNRNSPGTHMGSFLLPPSLSSFPAAFAKVDELATVNGIILHISHVAAPRLVRENHCVMALLCTFRQYLSAGNANAIRKHQLMELSPTFANHRAKTWSASLTPCCKPMVGSGHESRGCFSHLSVSLHPQPG